MTELLAVPNILEFHGASTKIGTCALAKYGGYIAGFTDILLRLRKPPLEIPQIFGDSGQEVSA